MIFCLTIGVIEFVFDCQVVSNQQKNVNTIQCKSQSSFKGSVRNLL